MLVETCSVHTPVMYVEEFLIFKTLLKDFKKEVMGRAVG
jgi:hypothetical protein